MAAYPHFNVNEMLVVQELYQQAVEESDRVRPMHAVCCPCSYLNPNPQTTSSCSPCRHPPQSLLVFNGELDRIRSGYYPSLFYPKVAALAKSFLPDFTTAYYIKQVACVATVAVLSAGRRLLGQAC